MITRRGMLSGMAGAAVAAAFCPVSLAASGLTEGTPLPDVELSRLDETRFRLASLLAGKVGLLSFWATWCGPCMVELPSLDRLHSRVAAEPRIQILAINVDQGMGAALLEGYWRRAGFSLPLALDFSGQASRLYRISMLPMAYLVSNQGKVRYALPGARSWESDQWVRGLMAMAQEGQSPT